MAEPAQETIVARAFNRERFARLADWLAVALVMSLPWSTSATGILVVLWLLALLPSLDLAGVRRELATAAGGLPVLLWAFGVVGTLWADVPWTERLAGLDSFHRLLVIPLLLAQFRRSERGKWVLLGFAASCTALLVLSWALLLLPFLPWRGKTLGILVKDYISQSAVFTVCIFVLADRALDAWRKERRWFALGLVMLALVFVANIFQIAPSRTALVTLPVLALLFGFRHLRWRGTLGLIAALVVVGAVAWPFSHYLQDRLVGFVQEINVYRTTNMPTPAGERLEFWKKSVGFIGQAPVFGHGTGSIRELFRQSAVGQTGVSATIAANPHNQTLTIAIQLGLVGAAVLFAMWIAHLRLFSGPGVAAWVGLVIVVQNIVGSLFNSHLFDFTHGWLYVIGVGIAGGAVLRSPLDAKPP